MATATFDATPSNASDAEFRAWGKGLSDALTAVGMVKTADTGQIDWATVVKPASAAALSGYEIWRFNDAMQATAPIFMKISYGASNAAATIPSIQTQLGKSSNGSGTLGTTFGAATLGHANSSGVPTSCYVHASEGALGIVLFPKLASHPVLVGVERSRASDGTPTGVTVIHWERSQYQQTTSIRSTVYISVAAVPGHSADPLPCTAFPLPSGSTVASATAPVFPILLSDGASAYWQSRLFMYTLKADTTVGVPVTITGRGTYLPLGNYIYTSSHALLMKWS